MKYNQYNQKLHFIKQNSLLNEITPRLIFFSKLELKTDKCYNFFFSREADKPLVFCMNRLTLLLVFACVYVYTIRVSQSGRQVIIPGGLTSSSSEHEFYFELARCNLADNERRTLHSGCYTFG